jgi:predicted DNA-binding transcriptional regulator YafY
VVLALRLVSGGRLRADEVAEEFGVDRRTVYRDILMLERYIPLERSYLHDGRMEYRAV